MPEGTIHVRIKFSKHGEIRYIGHLDVMRYFQKCFRRAKLDIAYSSGYSPHQIMSFAQPLSVGFESNGEYMDVELNSMTSCKDVVDALNQVGIPGLQVLEAKVLPEHAKNAMASVAAATYTVSFKKENPFQNVSQALEQILQAKEVLIEKEGKNGTRFVDIKAGIYDISWDDSKNHFTMMLDASSGGNIKPIQVINWMLSKEQSTGYENMLFVTREDTYTNIGTEEEKQFVPLIDVCEG